MEKLTSGNLLELCFLSLLLTLLALTQYMSLISHLYESVGERPKTSMAPQILANS